MPLIIWITLFLASFSFAGPSSGKPNSTSQTTPQANTVTAVKISDGQKDYCQFLWYCGLPKPMNYCPDSLSLGKPAVAYDSVRCSEGRLLTKRGVGPDHPVVGYKLYRFLGMEFRTVYIIDDFVPISVAKLDFLLNDLPFAAKLISHYQPETYTATYTDAEHTYFKGSKGKRLTGEARLISGSLKEQQLFYLGQGVAEIAWWKLRGPALMDFRYYADPKGLHYRMKILVFPGNGVINGIMNLGLFKKIVNGKIHDVLFDITETARKLAKDGGASVKANAAWSLEDKQKIEALLKLP